MQERDRERKSFWQARQVNAGNRSVLFGVIIPPEWRARDEEETIIENRFGRAPRSILHDG